MTNNLKEYEFWFITGSQSMYGNEVIQQVEMHSREIVDTISEKVCAKLIYKGTVVGADQITNIIKEANYNDKCAGIITWMHTFSPSKMWINGLKILNKPMLHLHTQYNREIPLNEIDMDFMNLNQSAHGDREHGFICTRLRLPRKVISGYWKDKNTIDKISAWMRSAIGMVIGNTIKIVRFADNMRDVAVTEGDKVETQIKLGWSVDAWAMGDLAKGLGVVTDVEVEDTLALVKDKYDIVSGNLDSIRYQIRIEIALKRFCEAKDYNAIVTNFENLFGLEQLPGLACQRLMEAGYGFGPEGDWKTAGLLRTVKIMESGLVGGSTFIEDYTYNLEKGRELMLGAHMLEVDPSVADGKIKIDVQPLSIGGKTAPARMIFEGHPGNAIIASLIDMGGRMRLVVADIEVVEPIGNMPKLPVARLMWKLLPNFEVGSEAWIYAGGAHHSVLSFTLNADILRDFAEMADIEFVHIGKETDIVNFKADLMQADILRKLNA